MSRSIHAAQVESLPYNHHLHQFLTFLKHERGFADATLVRVLEFTKWGSPKEASSEIDVTLADARELVIDENVICHLDTHV
jgi:hypothetical protein